MSLLSLVSRQALDEDYVRAARRRTGSGSGQGTGSNPRPGRGLIAAGAVLMIGILVATAAVQRSLNTELDDAGRTTLISRIVDERQVVSALQDRILDLRESNAAATEALTELNDDTESTAGDLRRLRVRTGLVAVSGPGVRVEVTNPAGAGPGDVVFDSDLALLVNGLWSAGAEAIAVNDQRLTPRTAIRNSGEPIEVNSVGVAPPYTITAIGDRRSLQANFFDTSSGLAFDELARRLDFGYEFSNAPEVSMPAGPANDLLLRNVRPLSQAPDRSRGQQSGAEEDPP